MISEILISLLHYKNILFLFQFEFCKEVAGQYRDILFQLLRENSGKKELKGE
jgi:hypothetical protein